MFGASLMLLILFSVFGLAILVVAFILTILIGGQIKINGKVIYQGPLYVEDQYDQG